MISFSQDFLGFFFGYIFLRTLFSVTFCPRTPENWDFFTKIFISRFFFRNKQRFYRYNLDLHVEYLYVETRYTRNILQEKNIKRTSGYPHSFVFIKRCTAVSVDECKQNSALACIHSSQNLEYISYVNKVMG